MSMLRHSGPVAYVVAVMFALACVSGPASAAMVGTPQLVQAQQAAAGAAARARLERGLVELGVEPRQARQRVAALTEAEVAQLAGRLDEAPAGGDALALVVVVFLVLLWTDIMGYTDIFPFVNKSPDGRRGPVVTPQS